MYHIQVTSLNSKSSPSCWGLADSEGAFLGRDYTESLLSSHLRFSNFMDLIHSWAGWFALLDNAS